MLPDFPVSLAGILILVAVLGYWFARSGEAGRGMHRRFREYAERLPRRSEKAVSAYLQEAEKESSDSGAAFELAAYFRSGGDWRRALQIHESLAARDDLDPATRAHAGLEIGDDYRAAGMLDRAEEAYVRTAEYLPLRLNALERTLGVCERLADWERAVGIAEQVRREDPSLGSRLRGHYCCELAAQAIGDGDTRSARGYWRKAARGAKDSPRLLVDRAVLDARDPGESLAVAGRNPDSAVLILAGLAKRNAVAGDELNELLQRQLQDTPALSNAIAFALLIAPELLCEVSARCLFGLLEVRLPAYARMYGSGQAADFSRERLKALTEELQVATGGPPSWKCTICGHQDEAHHWRCDECGAWESARLISPLAP